MGVPLSLGTSGGEVSFGPDGRALVLTPGYVPDYTFEHASRQWILADLDTGEVLDRGRLDFDAVWLATSPDGRHAAITGDGGELIVLDLARASPSGGHHRSRHYGLGHGLLERRVADRHDRPRRERQPVGRQDRGAAGVGPAAREGHLGRGLLARRLDGHDRDRLRRASTSGTPTRATRLEFACRLAGRDFTEAEWRQHFGGRPWQPTCPDQMATDSSETGPPQ